MQSEWSRSEKEISPELVSKFQEIKCQKGSPRSWSSGVSDECASARRVSSLLNKNVITVTYNDVSSISPPHLPKMSKLKLNVMRWNLMV